MKGLEAKGPFSCLGLQVRFRRAYQTPINYSFLWLVKSYLNSFSNYLTIIFESYVVLMTKLLAKSYKIDLKLKGPFEPNLHQFAKRPFCS